MKTKKGNIVITCIKVIVIAPLILFAFIVLFIIIGHYLGRWTEKEKQEFSQECSHTETVNGLGVSFTGYRYDEIEVVLVKRIHEGQPIDSFYISPHKDSYDKLRSRYWAYIDTTIYIKDSYLIVIPQYSTFVLSDMKMAMLPRFTMFSENYGCEIYEYSINGIEFKGSSTPDFIKQGFKFPWEESSSDISIIDNEKLDSEEIAI